MLKIKIKKIYQISQKGVVLSFVLGLFLYSTQLQAVEFNLDSNYNKDVWELNQDIDLKRKEIDDLKKQAQTYEKNLANKQNDIASLNNQVTTIDQTVRKISLEKEALELEAETLNLRIRNTLLKIQATENQIDSQKDRIASIVREIYYNDKESNLLVILATNNDLANYLTQLQHLETLQENVFKELDTINNLKVALIQEKEELDANKVELVTLETSLDIKATSLQSQKRVKSDLIYQTRGEEAKYQVLLQELKDEQNRVNNDIVLLEQIAREKLNRQIQGENALNDGPMIWPVPSQTVTAYFHDPDYPYRAVFEHPAIDIRANQGTPVKATRSGYVARAKDAGYGYSYIMIVHEDNITTVYGHVSAIYVAEGSFVSRGQVIGLSGATPGTPGAGRLTTGPHLHYEVRLNGIPVNPLSYLP